MIHWLLTSTVLTLVRPNSTYASIEGRNGMTSGAVSEEKDQEISELFFREVMREILKNLTREELQEVIKLKGYDPDCF